MLIKDLITTSIAGKVLEIAIKPSLDKENLMLINSYVAYRLEILVEEDVVKYFKNRIDLFVVFPQNDILVQDLKLDVEKKLGI